MRRLLFSSPRPLPAVLLCVATVVACGGSGDSGGPVAPGVTPAVEIEAQSFSLLNQARVDEGVPELDLRQVIAEVAREHSRRMRDEGFFGHRAADGRDAAQRLRDAGVAFRGVGENLGRVTNADNPARWIHDHLMASSEHRPNILNPDYQLAGVGVARTEDTVWVTQIFVLP